MESAAFRDTAKAANVSLGTGDFVTAGLKAAGCLIDLAKKGREAVLQP